MDSETKDNLDEMEQKLIKKMRSQVQNGYYTDASNVSQTLVNIAMYRRLVAGDKMRVRSDGTVDLPGAAG